MNVEMLNRGLAAMILSWSTTVTVPAQSDGRSDSERLSKLEEVMRQLRRQHQSHQERVGQLDQEVTRND